MVLQCLGRCANCLGCQCRDMLETIKTATPENTSDSAGDNSASSHNPVNNGVSGRDRNYMEAKCYDCGLPYTDTGFQDLVISDDAWLKISPTGHDGGLLCPTCICRALSKAGIETTGVFTSGPLCQK